MKKNKEPFYTDRRCCNCEYYVPHRRPMSDGCTHPLVKDWYKVFGANKACPLHKFVHDKGEEE